MSRNPMRLKRRAVRAIVFRAALRGYDFDKMLANASAVDEIAARIDRADEKNHVNVGGHDLIPGEAVMVFPRPVRRATVDAMLEEAGITDYADIIEDQ